MPWGFSQEVYLSDTPATTLYERNMEEIIAHESTHIAVYEVTKSTFCSGRLDSVIGINNEK